VIQKSTSLKYEPSSEPLHISVKRLFLNRSDRDTWRGAGAGAGAARIVVPPQACVHVRTGKVSERGTWRGAGAGAGAFHHTNCGPPSGVCPCQNACPHTHSGGQARVRVRLDEDFDDVAGDQQA